MKNQKMIPGMILIGFGLYFYLQQENIAIFHNFFTWPTLLLIVGLSFLAQGYIGKDYEAIFPGVILVGFGIHFHVVHRFELWPDHLGAFILIIALGFLLRYQKTGNGLFHGLLFLILAGLLLFYNQITNWLGLLENGVATAWKFWPAALILIGIFLLVKKK